MNIVICVIGKTLFNNLGVCPMLWRLSVPLETEPSWVKNVFFLYLGERLGQIVKPVFDIFLYFVL